MKPSEYLEGRIASLKAEVAQLRAERDAARAEVERLTDAAVIVQCDHPEMDAVLAERDALQRACHDIS